MLSRQKLLLAILEAKGEPVTRTVLVKLAFLLRQTNDIESGAAFYDFVPFRFGPFSFALYRELGALIDLGLVTQDDNELRLERSMLPQARAAAQSLPRGVLDSIRSVIQQYGRLTQTELVRQVYSMYPWFATRSELKDLAPKLPSAEKVDAAVYTVGYEGKSVDSFFNGLLASGIGAIVDVRANPISRKYGFAKRSMSEISEKLGVLYVHYPQLGISSAERAGLGTFESYQRLLDKYDQDLPNRRESIVEVATLLQSRPSALLCVEKNVACCHRGRLAVAVSKASDLEVMHLH